MDSEPRFGRGNRPKRLRTAPGQNAGTRRPIRCRARGPSQGAAATESSQTARGADHRWERRSDVRLRPTPPLVGRNRLNRMCVSDGHGLRLLPLRHPRHPALQLLPVLRTDDTFNARGQGAETLSVSCLSAVFSRRLNVGDPGIHWETFPIMDSGNRLPGRSELHDLLPFPGHPLQRSVRSNQRLVQSPVRVRSYPPCLQQPPVQNVECHPERRHRQHARHGNP